MKNDLQKRKNLRLQNYNYSNNGAYFITICTKDKNQILSKNVGCDDLGEPKNILSPYGMIVDCFIKSINTAYKNVTVDKYCIMPNHIHFILVVNQLNGVPWSSRPTQLIPKVITALKRMSNKKVGFNLWQTSYYDHIIRNEQELLGTRKYIDENPIKWELDKYFLQTNY